MVNELIKNIGVNDAIDEYQLDVWKHISEKLLKRYSIVELIEKILEISEGISDFQWKLGFSDIVYYDNGSIKNIRDKPIDSKKYEKTSGITSQIVSKIKITDIAKQFGLKVNNDKCICPFHKDTDPSLIFNNYKGTFKCWSTHCGKKGNLIDFIYECKLIGLVRRK